MALIIYPAVGYDSFVNILEAQSYIDALTLDGPSWASLPVSTQETLLRVATRTIVSGIDQTLHPLPNPAPVCLAEATALIASHDNVNSLTGGSTATTVSGALKSEKVGSLSVSYYDTKTTGGTTGRVYVIPKIAMSCLESIGYVFKTTSSQFRQERLGRS